MALRYFERVIQSHFLSVGATCIIFENRQTGKFSVENHIPIRQFLFSLIAFQLVSSTHTKQQKVKIIKGDRIWNQKKISRLASSC